MKFLAINGDDFDATPGINRRLVEAHQRDILRKIYGRWSGETHPEQIGVESLARMLETEIGEGFTEPSSDPGYDDPSYPTGYSAERETESRTLCSPRIGEVLAEQSIQRIYYHELAELQVSTTR